MTAGKQTGLNRREFLRRSALASGIGLARTIAGAPQSGVTIVSDPDDPIASAPAAQWAAGELANALCEHGIIARRAPRIESSAADDLCIVASGSAQPQARKLLQSANVAVPASAEALALVPARLAGRPVSLACGSDIRGLVYALLELADRVRCSDSPHQAEALNIRRAVVEQLTNAIRVISRSFESDLEDKPWFNDREFWKPYLTMLAAQRFNRFNLNFGLAYDFTRHITDCYFHFAYPFLLPVPGYDVRAVPLPDSERDHNLEMLRFISDQTVARGMDFQLGLWTHAFQWVDSPQANYTISGLTPETQAPYCRDALRALLDACPAISSLAFRVHGESGVPEESYDFWKTVFDGVVKTGRRIELNLHAKGIDQRLIDVALATGMPVTVSPKFWAEHQGLPYHQASIRETEKPPAQKPGDFFALSSGSRSFLRYSYGDLLTADRHYGVYTRIWPGTERVLLWGDPVAAAACSRAAGFCGEQGLDLFEPLSFKGRKGSGVPGGRCSYQDATLRPPYDWQKFLYTYRVWGRHLYNPAADPDVCRRLLRKQFGPAVLAVEAALAQASRILPLVTTAHAPSAANNAYWPEMYTNMAIVGTSENTIYGDSPSPKVFGNASSFDPQLFSSVNDCAKEMLGGERSGRFSPIDVAQWLEDMADSTTKYLAEAQAKTLDRTNPEFRRVEIDVAIQAGRGNFFAGKFRAGVLYAIFAQCGDGNALKQALASYRRARTAWANLAERARGAYAADITYGPEKHLRGHWLDRLPAIDEDITAMEKQLGTSAPAEDASATSDHRQVEQAIGDALGRPMRPANRWRHAPAPAFQPGTPLQVELQIEKSKASPVSLSARLLYRHVNQAENYDLAEMKQHDGRYYAEIPAAYTQSPYALQYFFEVHQGPKQAWLLPGFDPDLTTQPYFVVRRA
jgi:hypothetical protein